MNILPSAIQFGNQSLTVVNLNNQPWLTGPQIADALGMRDRRGVHELWTRHQDEFTPDMAQIIQIKRSRTRVFSPRGCHLIAMFARTDRAKAFRQWVLDVLEKIGQPQAPALPECQRYVMTIDNGQVKPLVPIPADSAVVNNQNIHKYIREYMREFALVRRQDLGALMGLARHRVEEIELESLGIENEPGKVTDTMIVAGVAKLDEEQRWQFLEELRQMKENRSTGHTDSPSD